LAKKWQEVEGEISHLQQYKNAFGASITTDMVIDAMINLEKSG
jgi:hypothetical protein